MMLPDLTVKRGMLVRIVLERFARAIRMLRIQHGQGIRLTETPFGTIVSSDLAGASYVGAFAPSLSGMEVRFARGLVNNREPEIDGVPLTGDDENPQPYITLDPELIDKDDQVSWIVIEVETNEEGRTTDETRLELAHTGVLSERELREGIEIGIIPITLITWQGGVPVDAYPVLTHNQRYERTNPQAGEGQPRHFYGAV